MILFTLQEQKSHLINLSLNLCWEFVTDVNENLNTHSTDMFNNYERNHLYNHDIWSKALLK